MQGLEFLAALRKRWLYVLVPIVVGLLAAVGVTYATTPLYQSTASVYFSLPTFSNTANDLFQGSNYTQNQLASYASLVTKPVVLDPVIKQLKLNRTSANLAASVETVVSSDTVLIDISVSDESATTAADIANAVSTQLGTVVRSLAPRSSTGQIAVDVSTVEQATPSTSPSSPNRTKNLAAGGLGGLILGLVLALARQKLDTRVRGSRDLPPGVPALTSIGFDKTAKKFPVVDQGHRRRAEAYRQLRTSLQFVDVDRPVRTVVITSSIPDEGKSSTAVNLAFVFAESGRRVLLIEADMRRPRVSDYLGLDRTVGLTDVLAGQASLQDVVQDWGSGGLSVLPSGSIPPNPSELLGSQSMADLMTQLRESYDFIVIDSPPVLPVTDAAVASAHADGVVLVARYGKVTRAQLAETAELLHSVDARVLGAVVNMAPVNGADSARYDGYGYYEEATSRAARPSAGSAAAGTRTAAPVKPLVPAATRSVRRTGAEQLVSAPAAPGRAAAGAPDEDGVGNGETRDEAQLGRLNGTSRHAGGGPLD